MPGVRSRHIAAAALGGVAAGGCVLTLSSLYSVVNGFTATGPYQSIGALLGFAGTVAIAVGIFVDFAIPLLAAFVMVATLALLSRTNLLLLELRSRVRALAEGGAVGLVIWAVFYVPVIEDLSKHAPLSELLRSLLFGLAEHVAFGAVIGIVLFLAGGPVTFRSRNGSSSASAAMRGPRPPPPSSSSVVEIPRSPEGVEPEPSDHRRLAGSLRAPSIQRSTGEGEFVLPAAGSVMAETEGFGPSGRLLLRSHPGRCGKLSARWKPWAPIGGE